MDSINGRLREECLNIRWFPLLVDARTKTGAWRRDYNDGRPQMSPGWLKLAEYAAASIAMGAE